MKPKFVPDLQDPSDGSFNTAKAETYASLIPFAASEGDSLLADTASETSLTSSYSSQDATLTGGQNSPDYDVVLPDGKAAYETGEDSPDTAVPEGSGSITPAPFFSTAGTPLPAPTIFPSSVVGSFEVHIADVSTGNGETVETLAHVDAQLFYASPNVTAPGHSAGLATAPVPADPPASAGAPTTTAELANPAQGSAGFITEAGIGVAGATAAQVQQALDESGLSVNGSGIKVGVLSDSFNDLGGAAADETDGALPSASNVDVIKDLGSGGTDEGRAMMQIIHDIAPGASEAFYTAFDSEQDFANGILALAAGGSKVIVDDVSYFDEPFFQNGVVAQAIQTVEAEGVTYVTAAGNDASNGYQAAWTPISGTFDGHALSDAESFGGSLVQTVTINTEGTGDHVPLVLEWNQAYGAATSDLEILVFHNGSLIGTATNRTSGESTNPWVEFDFPATGTYQVAIENLSGPNPGLIKEITRGDGLPATISGANSGTVVGHAMTPGAISAGAVSAADTPAFGFNPALSESFSSSGAGTELLFANNGSALSSPEVLSPVTVSGVDDISTTVTGNLGDFYGTSAASASLAGVAALILSADPNLTPAQVEQIMEETALPMANSAVSGAGLVRVDQAVAAAEALVTTVIESFGSTSLVQVGSNYFLDPVAGGTGPELKINGAPVVAGQFGAWVPLGAEATSSGYDVAWKNTATGLYTVWSTDSSGNFASNLLSNVFGTSAAFEAMETTFHQDLNRDGVIGVASTTIEASGSTSLVQVDTNYFLDPLAGGTGLELKYGGVPFVAGQFGAWVPLGAEATSSGYDVAWKNTATGLYTVWSLDSSGNFTSNLLSNVSGTSVAFESMETTFHQDLNRDGVIGVASTTIDASGSTSLVQVGSNYFLDPLAGGTGLTVKYGGVPFVAGQFGAWVPLGAEATSGGYDVAWKNTTTGLYTVWSLDSNGNFTSNLLSSVSGTSVALESTENTLHQDLNGDGIIDTPATVIEATGNVQVTLSHMTQAATIDAGATLELTGADSGSITFSGATGTLVLDHSSSFTGKLINLTGNGNPSSSDQIDLKDVAFGSGTTDSYAGNSSGGVLTISDAQHHTANISLVGNYTNSTFTLSSDGHGGTIAIDPSKDNFAFASNPAPANAPSTPSVTVGGAGNDGFVFHQPAGNSGSQSGFAHDGPALNVENSHLLALANEAQSDHQWMDAGRDVGVSHSISPTATHFADIHAGHYMIH